MKSLIILVLLILSIFILLFAVTYANSLLMNFSCGAYSAYQQSSIIENESIWLIYEVSHETGI